ncbi:hypothetical protein [Patiriisocius hiemis]|uniref:Uncharacterized protein n=1 Tax=Patiriisocius hiemis TaxID=3075604 RepID=A0ABU2YCE8_9FLAO|nr:hypothetical protein [Constantimarinum sp. W242]MDT0555437.1 hypothetical protein [Constantimarinum sp. W242]
MIEVNITKEDIAFAREKLSKVKSTNTGLSKFGSENKRILTGYVGERIVMKYLDIANDSDTYNYDIIFKDKKLEIKTISCKFKPRPDYWCTVNSHDLAGVHKQEADFYVFLRVLNDYSKGWLLGYMPCKDFFDKGTFVPKGKDFGKFKFVKANATILPIHDLRAIETLKNQA